MLPNLLCLYRLPVWILCVGDWPAAANSYVHHTMRLPDHIHSTVQIQIVLTRVRQGFSAFCSDSGTAPDHWFCSQALVSAPDHWFCSEVLQHCSSSDCCYSHFRSSSTLMLLMLGWMARIQANIASTVLHAYSCKRLASTRP